MRGGWVEIVYGSPVYFTRQRETAGSRSPACAGPAPAAYSTTELIDKAQRMYDARQFTMAEIAQSCGVTPMTIYRNIHTGEPGCPFSALIQSRPSPRHRLPQPRAAAAT
jgi:hypothetical protein